jgi:hypothetical protein
LSKRHHFLPQFYLRRFASQPKRITVFNLRRRALITGASIRDQCYKRRFHVHQELEDGLSALESDFAPLVDAIVSKGSVPRRESPQHASLLHFVALQMLRTLGAVRRVRQGFRGLELGPVHTTDG